MLKKVSDRKRSLLIADLEISPPVLAAPMAGYSNLATRTLYREFGAGACVTEMVSCQGLVENMQNTWQRLESDIKAEPVILQVFGGDPEIMARAAQAIEEDGRAQCIDINMGCPVRKITSTGYGSALLSDPKRIEKIITSMRQMTKLPISVKIRSGPTREEENYIQIGQVCEQAGASAIAIHPRSRHDGFTGRANWDAIAALKQAVRIPVIGNGDITDFDSALKMFDYTGCDAVMIGRGAVGNPWIFQQLQRHFAKEAKVLPSFRDILLMALKHFELEIHFSKNPSQEFRRMRKHLPEYFTDFSDFESLRQDLIEASSNEMIQQILNERLAQES